MSYPDFFLVNLGSLMTETNSYVLRTMLVRFPVVRPHAEADNKICTARGVVHSMALSTLVSSFCNFAFSNIIDNRFFFNR